MVTHRFRMMPLRRVFAGVVALALVGTGLVTPAAHAGSPPLRVLSWNVHTGIGEDGRLDLDRTAALIRASDADVVALQEVDVHWSARSGYVDQARALAEATGMEVFFAPIYDLDPAPGRTERRRYGVAVLSAHPILAAENHEITRRSTVDPDAAPTPAPGFAEVLLAAPGGPVRVYNTHLDYRPDPEIRRRQVADMLRVLGQASSTTPTVLAGDFNAGPDAPELGPLFTRLRDVWGTRTGGATYPAADPVRRIDYVTVGGSLRTRAAHVPETRASDHRPVLAELSHDRGRAPR